VLTENSPYGSPPCTVPFASPLTVPNDVLLRSPKLHAAFENQLPELPEITDDIGHILVHYLHTGTYESLKPKEEDKLAKQISELRTAIRAYATARAYDLPDLVRLAEKNIKKYGDGLSLPHLLEVTKEAHPTLSETDTWFLGYLRGRIRPHVEDPKALLTSNLLDQISSILSPNRVLLRTVLEMFVERIPPRPEPVTVATPPATPVKPAALKANPVTPKDSPASSRSASTQPPNPSSTSVLQMRTRAVPRDDLSPLRKKAVPWPSADDSALASWGKETTPEPVKEVVQEAPVEVLPQPTPAAEPTPAIEDQIKAAIETEIKQVPATLDSPFRPSTPGSPFRPSTPVRKRDRRDSAMVIPMTPEVEILPVKEVDPVADPFLKPRSFPPVLRQADSGFWDSPSEHEQMLKESTQSIVEIEPDYHMVKPMTPEPIHVHELEAVPELHDEVVKGIDTRDFVPEPLVAKKEEPSQILIISEPELPLAPVVSSKDPLESFPETEPEFDQVSELLSELENEAQNQPSHQLPVVDPKGLDRISEEDLQQQESEPKVEEQPQPEADKVEPPRDGAENKAGLTVQEVAQDPSVDATRAQEEPEPEAPATHSGAISDSADAPGPAEATPAEPVSEPSTKPVTALDLEAQPEHLPAADTDKKTVEVAADPAPLKSTVIQQTISAATPERQRSWRKRFLRVPVLFRQSM